ncbi:agmatine deiminase family protein [Candidatus Falkowbacteria bacterium]|nr:agmatine deiminase family protein [Candidatus Falkowbacteria bacterium]
MPAEWEKQRAVWIAWPHECKSKGYAMKLEGTYLRLVELMQTGQIVQIVVPSRRYREHIEQQFKFYGIEDKNISFILTMTDDVWVRDYGPTFVIDNSQLKVIKWNFNGYGGRYEFLYDNHAGNVIAKKALSEHEKMNISYPGIVLEGGNIETNGQGIIMLCKSAVLNPGRNPGITQKYAESLLKEYLGALRIIWLTGMVTENVEKTGWSDDTDTHVDTIVRFVDLNRVVAVWTDDKSDPAYELFQNAYYELKNQGLDVVKLPTVKAGFYSHSNIGASGSIAANNQALRTDASYANFVITNDKIIVPVYGKREDDIAKGILREQFPCREVVGLFAGHLAENGGEFHCLTQQEPAVS